MIEYFNQVLVGGSRLAEYLELNQSRSEVRLRGLRPCRIVAKMPLVDDQGSFRMAVTSQPVTERN